MIIKFANNIRMVFPPSSTMERETIEMASRTFGRVASSEGALKSSFVDMEMKRALDWLKTDKNDMTRYAAILMINELATHASALFYQYVK